MAASALWYYWLHRMAADCASGNIIKFDFSFNLSEKERDHTQCSETQTKGQEMGVAFRHSSGCENVGDNIEARKRELGAFNYFCKSERHKGGAAIWPQTGLCHSAATAFQRPSFKTVKVLASGTYVKPPADITLVIQHTCSRLFIAHAGEGCYSGAPSSNACSSAADTTGLMTGPLSTHWTL